MQVASAPPGSKVPFLLGSSASLVMAQACVMVQRDLENTSHAKCALTPAPPPMTHDASFITSSIRKRKKDDVNDEDLTDKKVRAGADTPLPKVQFSSLADCRSPAGGAVEARPPSGVPQAEPQAGVDGQKEEELFSPHFHLAKECHEPADNTSTDASTGTAASLDQADSEQQQALQQQRRVSHIQSPTSPTLAAVPMPPSAALATANAVLAAAAVARPAAAPEEDVEDDDDDCLDFDPFVFIKRLPPLHKCFPPRTSFLLPRQTRHSKHKKTLVLDLDETLVHSTLDGSCVPDFTFPVHMGPICHMVAVRKRPHLAHFLNRVAELFEVVVFTASQQVYAEQLLDVIDPSKNLIKHRIFRDSCVMWEGNYLKDLTVLGRDLAHTLIVDNSPQAFGFQLENGVPIESWYDDDEDVELLSLLPFLEEVARAQDVRPLICDRFRLKDLVAAAPVIPDSV